MAPRSDPSALAWLVGNELRQARMRLGETQLTAAKVIGCSSSRMNYLETGRTVQQADDVRTLMRFYGAPEADGERLAALVESPGRRTWWAPWEPVVPDHLRLFAGLEGFATAEFAYVPLIVPGLLQTEAYAASVFGVGTEPALHQDRVVDFRRARQQRLTDDDPMHYEVVLEEDALLRPVGGDDVMREQLAHLIAIADRSNVSLQVIPRSTAVHAGLSGGFTVFDFAVTQSIAYVAYPDGSVYVPDYHEVAGYLYRRRRLRDEALGVEESRQVFARLAG